MGLNTATLLSPREGGSATGDWSSCGGVSPPVRSKVKVKVTLELATKAQRESRGIAVLFLKPRR